MLHGKLAKDGYAHQLHGLFIAASLFLKQHLELRRDFFFLRWAPALSDRSAHMFRQFCILLRQGRTNPFTIRPESVSGYPLRPVWRPPLLLFQPLPKSSGRPAGFIDVSKPLLQINLANGTELIWSEAYAPDGPLSPPQPPKAPHPYSSHKSAGQYSLWGQKFSTGPDPSPVWKFPALPGFPRPALRATGGIPAALFPVSFCIFEHYTAHLNK